MSNKDFWLSLAMAGALVSILTPSGPIAWAALAFACISVGAYYVVE